MRLIIDENIKQSALYGAPAVSTFWSGMSSGTVYHTQNIYLVHISHVSNRPYKLNAGSAWSHSQFCDFQMTRTSWWDLPEGIVMMWILTPGQRLRHSRDLTLKSSLCFSLYSWTDATMAGSKQKNAYPCDACVAINLPAVVFPIVCVLENVSTRLLLLFIEIHAAPDQWCMFQSFNFLHASAQGFADMLVRLALHAGRPNFFKAP